MEQKFMYTKQNPKETANIINRLFFGWTKELFWTGTRKELVPSDLYRPLRAHESERLGNRLEEFWQQELQKPKQQKYINNVKSSSNTYVPRLEKALFRAFWLEYFCIGLLLFLQYGVLVVFQPILQSWIISYFKVNEGIRSVTKTEALIYAGCLVAIILMTVFIFHHCDLLSQQIGMKIRVACCSLIYRKILKLSKIAFTQTTPGQIVNFLSNDVSRFDEVCSFLNFIWITPLQIIIISTIVWQRIGILTIIALGSLLLMTLPFHSGFIYASRKLRAMIATLTDKRVQLMNELIAGIQVVKMYAWEEPFAKIVAHRRAAELKKIGFSLYVRTVYFAFVMLTGRTVLFTTLSSSVLMGKNITADLTFMLSTYFEILQLTTAFLFPHALMLFGETMVSIKRLEQFLLLEQQTNSEHSSVNDQQNGFLKSKKEKVLKQEVALIKVTHTKENAVLDKAEEHVPISIDLERVSANWVPNQLPPTLCNISIKIQSGELCVLVGPVGSGKSSLLHLLLKELPLGAGKLKLYCKSFEKNAHDKQGYVIDHSNLRVSYASQEAWLFSGTIRENILFGQPYNKDRYIAVTRACALTKDFQQLPYGDMSNVDEGGCSLSGGQKARVNLARAVYRQADVYLLDDPLSAVDVHVARRLFFKCIEKFLRGKTRILVTHQLQFLKQADTIVMLDRGCMKMQGTYDELSRSNKQFNEMINRITTEAKRQNESVDASRNCSLEKRPSRESCRISVTSNNSSVNSYDYEDQKSAPHEESEIMATGRIPWKIYKEYFLNGGSYCTLFILILTYIVSQAATSGNDYWVSYWTNLESVRDSLRNNSLKQQSNYLFNDTILSSIFTLDNNGLLPTLSAIYIYAFCVISCIVTVFLRNFFFIKICTNANQTLHNLMFSNILRAVMSFFHHNSFGRILNRFSKDVGTMDEMLPRAMLETVQIFLVILGILVMIVMVNHWMIIPLLIIALIFFFLRSFYLKTAQNVKRIESLTKSPVLSHINATLNGLTTIRSSGPNNIDVLRKQFDDLQDIHTGAWYITIVTPVVFGLLLDIIASFFIACICFSFILLDADNTLGGNVGLALSQSMIIIGTFQYGMKQSNNMTLQFTSVERILQYTNLPKESAWYSSDPPPVNWPKFGQVSLKNVSMKYETNEAPALKNLNVTIQAGWKVGVVGRTGAGKTSLISALFRLFSDNLEGEITIDGTDIKTLGLHELRSRLSIIPQQPFLLSESLRYNLDPFNSYDDTLLLESLRQVELNDFLLDQRVMPSGGNLSTGQRQLISLARAILKNNKIIILDEATANIDSHTDALIQSTIRTAFANCTVITIAHRLHTIIDSDMIIAMDNGRITEFGCPYELLRDKPTGLFSQMVNNMDASTARALRNEAEKTYLKNGKQLSDNLTRQNSSETDTTNTIPESEL